MSENRYEIGQWNPETVSHTEEKLPQLRRPYAHGPGAQPKQPQAVGRPVSEKKAVSEKKEFKLSPNAAVFTPRSKMIQKPTAVDDPPLVHVPSIEPLQSESPVVSVPSENVGASFFQDFDFPEVDSNDKRNADVVNNMKQVLHVMFLNPGCFDDYIHPLVHALNGNPLDPNQLESLTSFIYEQAIFDTNFTYTAAKVCNCLCKELVVKHGAESFRDILMGKLRKEYFEREASLHDPHFTGRLYQYTMFLAELFLNMEVKAKNDTYTKAMILRTALYGVMESLLKFQNEDNMHLLIRLLKLTGSQIEDFDIEQDIKTGNLNNIFSSIRTLILDQKLQRNTRQRLLDLIELRSTNWGRDTIPPAAQGVHSKSASGDSAVGVADPNIYTYFSPDGKVITEEESTRFYANENDFNNMDDYLKKWSSGKNGNSSDFLDDDLYSGSDNSYKEQGQDSEYDDEIATAFEEFLRMSNR
ncbi:polyadenylate-binding protein-interacting protein 1-like [Anneissia japonica]|uniref:polyadenylate-binding protein-interacting protein 1-like n=1 Tax=Anneissia japonica TaxID=1529436 RepID=UPI001425B72E|nr:polyadenylate-binding protein-interacting protein 1-like [Anneissia japonica]